MNWFEVRLKLPEGLVDSVSNRLFELGAEGVDESEYAKKRIIRGFFPSQGSSETLREIQNYLKSVAEMNPEMAPVELETVLLEDENWGDSYKKYYVAQPLSKNLFLRPAWAEPTVVPKGMIEIVLEPGQAFGTGLHPTTKLSLQLIEQALRVYPDRDKIRLLDIGTGSGILAIAARKLGIEQIVAIDIDPIAVEVAKENAALNHCKDIEISDRSLGQVTGSFDIIVSNILLETHRELAPTYLKLLKPSGHLILSGLLGGQRKEVLSLFEELGCVIECQKLLQEWMAFRFSKVSDA